MENNDDDLPAFMTDPVLARELEDAYLATGYRPIASIMAAGGLSVRQMVQLHERGTELMRGGALVGPYFLDDQLICGVKIYQRQEGEQ